LKLHRDADVGARTAATPPLQVIALAAADAQGFPLNVGLPSAQILISF